MWYPTIVTIVRIERSTLNSVFTNKELWSYRLSVRTLGFHPKKRGSIPRSSSKFMDMMCQLPDAGMKFPNSIGERSGLDSQYCPPSLWRQKLITCLSTNLRVW